MNLKDALENPDKFLSKADEVRKEINDAVPLNDGVKSQDDVKNLFNANKENNFDWSNAVESLDQYD